MSVTICKKCNPASGPAIHLCDVLSERDRYRGALERLRSEYGGTNVQAICDAALAGSLAQPSGNGEGGTP